MSPLKKAGTQSTNLFLSSDAENSAGMMGPAELSEMQEQANKVPSHIRFGTSTWTYPGWRGIVYHRQYKSERSFNSNALSEYVLFPWFRTVGIDNTFYRPASLSLLHSYAEQTPSSFRWVSKVWEAITIFEYPRHPRYGKVAGMKNENFLNPRLFLEEVLPPYEEAGIRERTGPFVFQFGHLSPSQLSGTEFFERLDSFLAAIPRDFQYAIEVRNPEFLCAAYLEVLNKHRVTHCFNHWTNMPPLRDQMHYCARFGGLLSTYYVARLLTPLEVPYEQAVKRFAPYASIQEPNHVVRGDAVVMMRRAIERKAELYILVNNRLEGCAPLTIDAIGRLAIDRLGLSSSSGTD